MYLILCKIFELVKNGQLHGKNFHIERIYNKFLEFCCINYFALSYLDGKVNKKDWVLSRIKQNKF